MSNSKQKISNTANEEQVQRLLFLLGLEDNHGLVSGDLGAEFWEEVTLNLNFIDGGCTKNPRGWMKLWSNLVGIAKQNLHRLIDGVQETPLTDRDVNVLRLIGMEPPTGLPVAEVPDMMTANINVLRQPSAAGAADRPSSKVVLTSQPRKRRFCSFEQLLAPLGNTSNRSSCNQRAAKEIDDICNPTTKRFKTSTIVSSLPGVSSVSEEIESPEALPWTSELFRPFLEIFISRLEDMMRTVLNRLDEMMNIQTSMIESYIEEQNRVLLDNVPVMMKQEISEGLEPLRPRRDERENRIASQVDEDDIIPGPSRNTEEEDSQCPVCHDPLDEPKKLFCGHIFCKSCIKLWLIQSSTCPICREVIEKDVTLRNDLLTFNVDSESSNDSFYLTDP